MAVYANTRVSLEGVPGLGHAADGCAGIECGAGDVTTDAADGRRLVRLMERILRLTHVAARAQGITVGLHVHLLSVHFMTRNTRDACLAVVAGTPLGDRTFAEFENFKKRTARERVDMFKTAGADVIGSLLPVLDDFERALKEIEKSEDDSLHKGVELIHNKLRETLKSKGLHLMDVKPGDAFDADSHEAITQIPAPEDKLKGKIIDVVEKGYTLGDKIIRYPKVVIGQ